MIKWIETKKQLPPEGQYVLGFRNGWNWRSGDMEHVNMRIIKINKGISQEEREKLPEGDPRKREYRGADEWSNNHAPYNFEEFGAHNFFGQEITHWMPLPDAPIEYLETIKEQQAKNNIKYNSRPEKEVKGERVDNPEFCRHDNRIDYMALSGGCSECFKESQEAIKLLEKKDD